MGIEGVITWYQKKIGTYDRQLWEKTIEQRILRGLANIQFRNAVRKKSLGTTECDDNYSDIQMKPVNLKTEFIDIDLVRGSSFTKAKPKHGFITVAKLATLRFFLLPLYSKWWVQQTSGKIFILLLSLYLIQLFNVSIYSYSINKLPEDSTEYVPCTEVVVPIIMMWVLSLIHSQIVSTQSDPAHSHSQRQFKRTYKRRRKPKIHPLTKLSTDSSALKTEPSESIKINKGVISKPSIKIQKDNAECSTSENNLRPSKLEHPLDDDGFESFNGNGSTPTDDTTEEYEAARSTGSFTSFQNGDMTGAENNDFESDVSQEAHAHKIENLNDKDEKWNEHINKRTNYGQSAFWSVSGESLQNGGIKKNDTNWGLERQHVKILTDSTSCESEEDETILSSNIMENGVPLLLDGATTTEWMGGTTNTEDCSYSSEPEPSDTENILWDTAFAPTAILSPSCALSDKVNCTIWKKNEIRKVELSVFDISCEIIARVEEMAESMDYFYIGMFYAVILALLPAFCRLSNSAMDSATSNELQLSVVEISGLVLEKLSGSLIAILDASLGITLWERTVMIVALLQRFILASLFFFLLSVAERTFKQRFLYAKLFSHLTSSRRARKSQLPHFRLNKVRNIKTWLSVRSYLKKRGPQRSVDVIVSSAFVITLLLLSFLSMELLKDSTALQSQYNIEALFWCFGLGCLLLRFITLGTKINHKYRSNLSILITEQINLYLQIEQKPHKKDELNVANSVLKLAADLLKELETPFKISGFSANPHLYTITKVFVLSALSGVLSEMLGFKLKLHKIKIK